MRSNKFIALFITSIIVSFSFLGILHMPGSGNRSFKVLKAVIPYPGKTVLVINKIIKSSVISDYRAGNMENTSRKTKAPKKKSDKALGLLWYLLGSLLVMNDMTILIFMGITLVVAFINGAVNNFNIRRDKYGGIGDINYYKRWRCKFIDPVAKCIENLAKKYDSNPILIGGKGISTLKRPAFCFSEAECGSFFIGIPELNLYSPAVSIESETVV
jgi:hypothetical protein